jgi:hypothetical protein
MNAMKHHIATASKERATSAQGEKNARLFSNPNTATDSVLHKAVLGWKRMVRIIHLCFIQRSISRALWVQEYETATERF